MPPRRNAPAPQPQPQEPVVSESTALALPTDVREDLLRAQRGMIGNEQRLPQVRLMPAGAGLYEFTDSNVTERSFHGVILGAHARNVLWDRPFGSQAPGDEGPVPACSSEDGQYGAPRQGFAHAALQPRNHQGEPVTAVGTERIECRRCPYNQWGSKGLIPALLRQGETAATAKGKAVVNQRAVYILVEGREAPVELILPPTSIAAFDEYLAHLLNRGIPVQAVVTEFTQEIKTKNGVRWGQATFQQDAPLSQEAFSRVLVARQDYRQQIEGVVEELVMDEVEAEPSLESEEAHHTPDDGEADGTLPF